MIFNKVNKEPVTKDRSLWKKRFAFYPVCVAVSYSDEGNEIKTYLWLSIYEFREYFVSDMGTYRECRRLGSNVSFTFCCYPVDWC